MSALLIFSHELNHSDSFGAAFTSFYRLRGPYQSPTAPQVVKTEIWDTITRRGLLGNLVMGVIPMVFYLIVNSAAFCAELVWTVMPRSLKSKMRASKCFAEFQASYVR